LFSYFDCAKLDCAKLNKEFLPLNIINVSSIKDKTFELQKEKSFHAGPQRKRHAEGAEGRT
jgi:hypothetical protein